MEIPPFWCRNLAIKKTVRKPLSLKQKLQSHGQFSYAARCFMPKILIYQTQLVCEKINVYCSLLPSDRVIG